MEQSASRSARAWLLIGSWLMLSSCAEVLDIPTEPHLVRDGMKDRPGMWSHSGRAGWRRAPEAEGPGERMPDAAADLSAAELSAAARAAVDAARPPLAGAGSLGDEELLASWDAGPDALLPHTDELPRGQRMDDGNRAGAAR